MVRYLVVPVGCGNASPLPNRPNRRSIRLRGYDYTLPGAYFVTLCTHQRQHLFGAVDQERVALSDWGRIVVVQWRALPRHFGRVRLDAWVIMPNHLHAIVWLVGEAFPPRHVEPPASSRGQAAPSAPGNASPLPHPAGAPAGSLGAILGSFKSVTARRINRLRQAPGMPVWQRNYFEHIVRSEEALSNIRQYILDNPKRWHLDRYHPAPAGPDPHAAQIWRLLHT